MARFTDPAFEIGMALGNAYGNMWAAKAHNRQKEKANKLIEEMMGGVTSQGTNAVQQPTAEPTAQDVKMAINGWPIAVTADGMRQKLRSNNINQKVIDEIMPGYEKQIKQKAFENLMPGIMGDYTSGKFEDAIKGVAELRKYDADMANVLLKDVYAAARDNRIYNRNRADKLADLEAEREYQNNRYYRDRADKLKDVADKQAHEEKVAYIKLGGSGGSGRSGQLTQQVNAAKALLDDREAWNKNHMDFNGNITEPYPYEAQAESAVDFLAKTYGYAPAESGNKGLGSLPSASPAVSANYAQTMTEWEKALTRNKNAGADVRWSKQQLIDYAKKNYGADAEAIIRNTDWQAFGF